MNKLEKQNTTTTQDTRNILKRRQIAIYAVLLPRHI